MIFDGGCMCPDCTPVTLQNETVNLWNVALGYVLDPRIDVQPQRPGNLILDVAHVSVINGVDLPGRKACAFRYLTSSRYMINNLFSCGFVGNVFFPLVERLAVSLKDFLCCLLFFLFIFLLIYHRLGSIIRFVRLIKGR